MDAEKRKEILRKGLILSEEDTLQKFESLITKSRKLFAIDGKTGKIVFEPIDFSNHEKICLFLIGKYFAKEISLTPDYKFTSREISDELSIKITTLSAPIGKLLESGYISQEGDKYVINHYKVEEILDSLILKYQEYSKKVSAGLALKSNAPSSTEKKDNDDTKENKESKKTRTTKVVKEVPPDIKFSVSPSGIGDMAKDLKISEDQIKKLFEFEEGVVHLLRKKHYNKDADEIFYNAIMYITAIYYHLNQREIASKVLVKGLKGASIDTGAHFKRDIVRKERRAYLLDKGDTYKITDNGIKLGLNLIKEMTNA